MDKIEVNQDDTNQTQNPADDGTNVDDTPKDELEGVVIDGGEDDVTVDDADEGGEDSDEDNADEGDKDSDEDKDKQTITKEDKAAYAFKKKSAQLREEKEKRETLERKLAETTQKLAQFEAPKRPVVPPMPDTYDPQYEAKVLARDEVIKAAANFDAEAKQVQDQVRQQETDAHTARQAHVKTLSDGFNAKADALTEALELKPGEFKQAEKNVAETLGVKGIPIAEHLISHEQGPAIVNFLGNDDIELDKVASMTPMDAAVYIATEIAPKLADLTSTRTSKAPKAHKVLKGKGKVKTTNPYLKGAKFT